jgi:hypothetical protein
LKTEVKQPTTHTIKIFLKTGELYELAINNKNKNDKNNKNNNNYNNKKDNTHRHLVTGGELDQRLEGVESGEVVVRV